MLKQLLLALKRLLRALGPVLVGCIFLGAVYLLYREISKYSLADIRMSLAQISTGSIILSVLLAIINYIILIGYDWLALKGIHKTLPVSRVSLVSFVGQAVSYNFGALLGGSTVRFRFYSSWGFSPMDIVRLVLMLAITFWVGALGLVGAIFMIAPPEIPPELGMHMPLDIRPLGAILFLIAISYLIVCKFIHKPIHIFGKEFAFPPFKIAVAQAVVAGADLVAAGACLYVLLPPDAHVSFLQFLPTYLMAMVAVVLTHVPGGAGVLEVVILHLTTASPQAVFAALLCFRVIYYLLPLLLAAVIFAIYEVRQQAIQESGVLHDAGRWMWAFAPRSWRARCSASEPSCASTSSCPSAPNGSRRSGNGSPSASSSSPAWRQASPGSCCCSSRAAYSIGSAPPSGWPSPCCASGLSAPCCIP